MMVEVSWAIHCNTKFEPMNPAPPVTRIVSACMWNQSAPRAHYHDHACDAFSCDEAAAVSGGGTTGACDMNLSARIFTILAPARPSHFCGIWRVPRKASCC